MSVVKETEFNGKPVIELYRTADSQFGFKFGVGKAKLILEHLDTIKAFVEKYDKVPAQAG